MLKKRLLVSAVIVVIVSFSQLVNAGLTRGFYCSTLDYVDVVTGEKKTIHDVRVLKVLNGKFYVKKLKNSYDVVTSTNVGDQRHCRAETEEE